MKQQILLISVVALLCFCSCTTTYNVISKTALDKSINQLASEMEKYGYYPAGNRSETRNEVTVTGQSYSQYTGYGTKMSNNYLTSDTYLFSDTAGNTMNYIIGYQLRNSNGLYYVTEVEVKGCETSNVKDYNKLCGSNVPKQLIETIQPDTTVRLYDEAKTYLFIGCIVLIPLLLAL